MTQLTDVSDERDTTTTGKQVKQQKNMTMKEDLEEDKIIS